MTTPRADTAHADTPHRDTPHVIALDVGGTGMKAALFDSALTAAVAVDRPTPRRLGPEAVLDAIVSTLADLARTAARQGLPVAHTGVVVPGIVDDPTGRVVYAANLGFADLPLAEVLRERTGLAVTVGHDVRAGAAAEAARGAARGTRHALFVPIGTGIAGGFVVDGRPLTADGYAGEIGHIVVDPTGPACGCGGRGCLEALASGPALAAALAARTGRAVRDAAQVADLVREGDADAREVWDRAVDALGVVLAALTTALAPEVVVIGGGVGGAGDLLLTPLRSSLAARLTFQRVPRVTRAALGDRAGCLGAGLLAWRAAGTDG
ncbi:ROK family protein [Streptomyces sp. NPDC002057]|uniref:ROK family protein n=1 Tax=Streptomyces sp. NPDC002057 TaxID=3154664 RepID=UPI00332AC9D7